MAVPKLFLLFLGLLVCILVTAAIWDRRIKVFSAFITVGLGIFLVSIALRDNVAATLGGIDVIARIRLVAVLASFGALGLTAIAFRKTGMHPRYCLLWSAVSLLLLLIALFPQPLAVFPSIFGVNFASTITVIGILFLLLLVFHFSIVISELRDRQNQLCNRITELEGGAQGEVLEYNSVQPSMWKLLFEQVSGWNKWPIFTWKNQHGTSLTAPIIIFLAVTAVLLTGMFAPQVMIGDEVTHYYMMQTQSRDLSSPNFFAEIPTGWGEVETRRYPHSFLWHYVAAVVYTISNGSFAAVQIYHAFFLAQLLSVAYLLAASRGGVEDRSALVYLLLIASVPMVLIFSVAFYQDVPMTAQVLTAFYLLRRGRWLLATFFICLALGLKVTAILFFPAFFSCLLYFTFKTRQWPRSVLILLVSLFLVCAFTWGFGKTIEQYSHAKFYPVEQVEKIIGKVKERLLRKDDSQKTDHSQKTEIVDSKQTAPEPSERVAEIIANHPGDLRIPVNFVIYGGVLLYLVLACAVLTIAPRLFYGQRSVASRAKESSFWLWGTGLSYVILVVFLLRTAPDARFFLPGVVFCALPLAERLVLLPRPRFVVMIITVLAIMQAGYSLAKTYRLRHVGPEIEAAVLYLQKNPPEPNRIFMYPEGNYRLFPVPHEWYLNYYLRDFWRADNSTRILMLKKNAIGAVVIKKYLIDSVDEAITDLGVYPRTFVEEIAADPRFKRVFENSKIMIYQFSE